jgi:hypothetical protein
MSKAAGIPAAIYSASAHPRSYKYRYLCVAILPVLPFTLFTLKKPRRDLMLPFFPYRCHPVQVWLVMRGNGVQFSLG